MDESDDTVDKVLCFIQDNLGCHLRRIKRAMDVSIGTIQYQLDKLEKMGRITSGRHGLYKYYLLRMYELDVNIHSFTAA